MIELLAQAVEEGHLSDSQGRRASLTNAVVVFTTSAPPPAAARAAAAAAAGPQTAAAAAAGSGGGEQQQHQQQHQHHQPQQEEEVQLLGGDPGPRPGCAAAGRPGGGAREGEPPRPPVPPPPPAASHAGAHLAALADLAARVDAAVGLRALGAADAEAVAAALLGASGGELARSLGVELRLDAGLGGGGGGAAGGPSSGGGDGGRGEPGAVARHLGRLGLSARQGLRPLQAALKSQVLGPVAELALARRAAAGGAGGAGGPRLVAAVSVAPGGGLVVEVAEHVE